MVYIPLFVNKNMKAWKGNQYLFFPTLCLQTFINIRTENIPSLTPLEEVTFDLVPGSSFFLFLLMFYIYIFLYFSFYRRKNL